MNNTIIKINRNKIYIRILCLKTFLVILLAAFSIRMPVRAVSPEWSGGVASSFAGGAGTETNPYLISTGEQLAYFSQQVNNGTTYLGQHIRLTQNILLNSMNPDGTFVNLSPREFTRIGYSPARSFKGTFDGNGYEVIGIYINKSNVNYEGLFGYAEAGSVIRNVVLSGSVSGGLYSGGLAGYTNGLIEGCETNCFVTADWKSYHGGVAGYADASSAIINCAVTGDVEGSDYAGGIAGYTKGFISECVTDNAVSNSYSNYHGGIAGYAGSDSLISECTVSGTVIGRVSIGGIAGCTEGQITLCDDDTASVTGYSRVGGMAGYASGASSIINNCTFSGTITGTGSIYTGGIAGQADGSISECVINSATVTGTNSYIGGVVGYASGTASRVIDCTVTVVVNEASGGGYAGGVAGRTDGEISGCTVNVTVTCPNSYIGGVAGYSAGANSKIVDCTVSGIVHAISGEGYVGGIAGKTDGEITECTVDATVSGVHHYVGGVVGYASTSSEVTRSVTTGDVSGNSEVGGVAGYTDGIIAICINTGSVTGNNGHTGGVAGMSGGNCIISNSFNSGAIDGGDGQGGIGGIIGYVDQSTVLHHNLNQGTVEGNQYVGCVTGNELNTENAWNNYYYDYEGSPDGTNNGDVLNEDGAVPIGELSWEEVCALLNTDEDESEDVWSQDLDDDGIPKPQTSTPQVKISSAGIIAGKYFTFESFGDVTSANVTSDSVFSVAFDVYYSSDCNLSTQSIGISKSGGVAPLPENTSIIMMADGFYYYINLTAEFNERIPLGEFVRMGSETELYPATQVVSGNEKEFLFVFDFTRTAGGITTGTYQVELLDMNGEGSGIMPTVTTEGRNTYSLSATGGINAFTAELSCTTAAGYDYKTDGTVYAYEFFLEKNGVAVFWPVGTRLNGVAISSALPYAFTETSVEGASFTIDMQDCAAPLPEGSYTVRIKAYACADDLKPRGGYPLASGQTDIALTAPAVYGIRAEAGTRIFDRSVSPIPVDFNIQTLGSGAVRSTLQYKYGTSYSNITGQAELPVAITGDGATLSIPANSAKGTYRFVISKYDGGGVKRAETVENIIVK